MCTFKITNFPNILEVDQYLKLGGPDVSKILEVNGIYLTHHLLSITGEITPQPILNDSNYFLLMGEIYDYDRKHPSDIYHVIEMYNQYGDEFTNHLDGEFLIVIYDTKRNVINFYTDPWSTRQAWFDKWDDYFYFGTFPRVEVYGRFLPTDFYGKGELIRLRPNSHYMFDVKLKQLTLINSELHSWNLKQFKTNFRDFHIAFEEAVLKRYNSEAMLCFSGGIDSACLAACLSDHNKPLPMTNLDFTGAEDFDTIEAVKRYCNFPFRSINKPSPIKHEDRFIQLGLDNSPLVQLSQHIENRVILQGNGVDEVLNNYLNKRETGEVRNWWPQDLRLVFPWYHFYNGQVRKIIDKKELICLHYGQELRNVFLDKKLVQEWLHITHVLKNSTSKAPLKVYLHERGIPLPKKVAGSKSQQIGFRSLSDDNLEWQKLNN
jgi:asparagine synthetase B (glutamine-hydrolysing)